MPPSLGTSWLRLVQELPPAPRTQHRLSVARSAVGQGEHRGLGVEEEEGAAGGAQQPAVGQSQGCSSSVPACLPLHGGHNSMHPHPGL